MLRGPHSRQLQPPRGPPRREGHPHQPRHRPAHPPLFPSDFRNDVSVMCTVMAVDHDCSPEVAALIGTSAALAISDIPWNGPVGRSEGGPGGRQAGL